MNLPIILVTGATGKTGSAVVAGLRSRSFPVRAIVRAHDARSEALERLGAETVIADVFDPDQLLVAMQGTSRAYYCPPFHPFMLQSASAFAAAAREAKLESIVGLSQWLASPSHPSLMTRQHWLADDLFSQLPTTAYTSIAPGFFADNYLIADILQFAAQLGVMPWPYGDSQNAPPSNDDIARVAVAALADPERHAGRSYRPTGPELLGTDAMIAIIGRALGRRLWRFDLPQWMFPNAMHAAGRSRFEQANVVDYVRELRAGTFAFNAPTDHVFEATGAPAESFEATARRYAAAPRLRRTLGNALRALGRFARIGVLPPRDLAKYAREALIPQAPAPLLSIEDERWLIAHDAETPVRTYAFPLRYDESSGRPFDPSSLHNRRAMEHA